MQLQSENRLNKSTVIASTISNCQIEKWDVSQQKLIKINIQLIITQNSIIYQKNGAILRTEQICETFKNSDILFNLEQIQSLSWYGQLGSNKKKNGKWIAAWDKIALENVGGYFQEGQQIGLWKDFNKNFWSQARVFTKGEYSNGSKIGKWSYFYKNLNIGGGRYNKQGYKCGKWVDLDQFWNYSKITYIGEYNEKGMKVGVWDFMYQDNKGREYQQIGGGVYDQDGSQKQIGKWIELLEGFYDQAQVIYKGEFNQNGQKVGRWDIMYFKKYHQEYKQMQALNQYNKTGFRGGGFYDQGGIQKKIGDWVEIDEEFYGGKQLSYKGLYNQMGIKIGRWDIMHCNKIENEFKLMDKKNTLEEGDHIAKKRARKRLVGGQSYMKDFKVIVKSFKKVNIIRLEERYVYGMQEFQKQLRTQNFNIQSFVSGGGSYNQGQGEIKIGEWVELDEEFCGDKMIIYKGVYNMKGKKVSRWDIFSCMGGVKEQKRMGGGKYDEEGNQIKVGKWVELHDGLNFNNCVTFNGLYNMKGIKVGRWQMVFHHIEKKNRYIDGGLYDQEGEQKKIGKWVELYEDIDSSSQLIYVGEYNVNGLKFGKWDIMEDKWADGKFKQLGGGSYDQEGNQKQIGKWIELDRRFPAKQIIYGGHYNTKGMKVGRWDSMCNFQEQCGYRLIGGGQYDQEGNQKKIGRWVELDEEFVQCQQFTYVGEYNRNGIKVGRWNVMYCKEGEQEYKEIGGGSYYQYGDQKKIGKWIELDEDFDFQKQFILIGQYNLKGIKIGTWVEMDIKNNKYGGEERFQD